MKETILTGNDPHPLTAGFGDPVLLDLRMDGHYFRTGKLLDAAVTLRDQAGTISDAADPSESLYKTVLLSAGSEIESDEYDLLRRLAELLQPHKVLVTFHGTSSILPFLSKKYKLYGLADALEEKQHIDLADVLRPLYYLLRLPSRKAEDFLCFLGDGVSDPSAASSPYDLLVSPEDFAAVLPHLTYLLPYIAFLDQPFNCISSEADREHLYFTVAPPSPFPKPFSFRAGPFYLSVRGEKAAIAVQVFDGKVKYFYKNYKDFYFLAEEGYAVDKRIGSLVPKERRVPCRRDTAYSFTALSPGLSEDTPLRKQYLESVRFYIRGEAGM